MRTGSVITFYSYKGGVGRTFVLANIAVILAKWGYRVLCVDWDLEAPGLRHYFEPLLTETKGGLLECIEEYLSRGTAEWQRYVLSIDLGNGHENLKLIPASGPDPNYIGRVQAIDWSQLYEEKGFGLFLEKVRGEWKEGFDFVLVDSRTGITDIGGICTVQLPDILVCALVANAQNLEGVLAVAQRALATRNRLPYDRGTLLILPLLCRFVREEYELGKEWLNRLADSLAPFYANWLSRDVSPRDVIDRTLVPYVSVWAFGERLPVTLERSSNPEYVSYPLETIAALLAHSLERTDLLKENRDSYVASAARVASKRGRFAYDVYLSIPGDQKENAGALAKALYRRGLNVFLAEGELQGTVNTSSSSAKLAESQHLVAILGNASSMSQRRELEQFLQQAIEDRTDRIIIPVLAPGTRPDHLPALMRNYQTVPLEPGGVEQAADRVRDVLTRGELDLSFSEQGRSPSTRPTTGTTRPLFVEGLPLMFLTFGFSGAICAAIALFLQVLTRQGLLPNLGFSTKGLVQLLLPESGWPGLLAGTSMLGPLAALYARVSYRLTDVVLFTPISGREHVVPLVINTFMLFALFLFVFGGEWLSGAIIFGLSGAAIMVRWLDAAEFG